MTNQSAEDLLRWLQHPSGGDQAARLARLDALLAAERDVVATRAALREVVVELEYAREDEESRRD